MLKNLESRYRLLQIVALEERNLRSENDGVSTVDVAIYLGLGYRHTNRLLSLLYKARIPYIYRPLRGGVRLTEKGWETVSGLLTSPYNTDEAKGAQAWINRVRWPWLEADSKLRAVVPMSKQ